MIVSIAEEIKADASLIVLIGRINNIPREIVGEAWDPVTVKWDLAGDLKSRILVPLSLVYEGRGAATTIDPAEMENPVQLKSKLRDLWGDLIRVRLHELVAKIRATLREGVGS